jgi:CRISPR-associated protein Cst1
MAHSNSRHVQRFWATECIKEVLAQISRNEITGCFNPKRSKFSNSLFYMIQRIMSRYETRWSSENATIEVYCFSNDNRKAELDIYTLPAGVFRFLAYVWERQFQDSWGAIVRSGYQGVKWNEIESEGEYKHHKNLVYERLLAGQSILGFFLNRPERRIRGDWELLTLYLKEVRHMDEARLATLKRVGDAIADSIRKSGSTRRLGQLERAGSYRECRNVLRLRVLT